MLRFARDRVMGEAEVQKMIRAHGFTIANLSSRLTEGGQQFEYRMTIKSRDRKNAEKLSSHLRGLPELVEFRIAPTGDWRARNSLTKFELYRQSSARKYFSGRRPCCDAVVGSLRSLRVPFYHFAHPHRRRAPAHRAGRCLRSWCCLWWSTASLRSSCLSITISTATAA